ncbi:ArsR/SmtB family transcription factor [Enterococcus casseliflavus]|uniref:ArsR/SmtB family transcription factor n=1 Tax=Enterococcus casseliflavus TaxID=37734 RepID=UPI0039A4CB19
MQNEEIEISIKKVHKIIIGLGDPNRIKILYYLMHQKRNVTEVKDYINRSHTATSHHLSTLKKSNLVSSEKLGKYVYYSLKNESVKKMLMLLFDSQ